MNNLLPDDFRVLDFLRCVGDLGQGGGAGDMECCGDGCVSDCDFTYDFLIWDGDFLLLLGGAGDRFM